MIRIKIMTYCNQLKTQFSVNKKKNHRKKKTQQNDPKLFTIKIN